MPYDVNVSIEVKLKNGGSSKSTSYNASVKCNEKTDFGIQEGARNYVLKQNPGWSIVDMKVKKK